MKALSATYIQVRSNNLMSLAANITNDETVALKLEKKESPY